MDILIINSLIVLNSLKSVMITTNYFGATLTERLPYTITELLCGCCCSDCRLLASRVLYGLRILSCSWLLRRRRYCCVSLLYCHYQGYCLSNYPKCYNNNNTTTEETGSISYHRFIEDDRGKCPTTCNKSSATAEDGRPYESS